MATRQWTKEWVEAYFDYGIDRANRRVFLFDGIEDLAIGNVIKGLYYMDSANSTRPIELFIGSFGGSEYEMFALYDVIRTLKAPIHTTAIGKCMSAAPLLVACGQKGYRFATPNTWFMVHQSWDDFGAARVDEMAKNIEHFNAMTARWDELMAIHTKKNRTFWHHWVKSVGDKYFDAYKAQELGIIDHIWDEKDQNAKVVK